MCCLTSGLQRGENGQQRVKEIKGQYEQQLKELRAELKQLKTVKKEHARAMKKNAEQDRQLKLLNSQLHDMKKQRVKMMNKMRQEASEPVYCIVDMFVELSGVVLTYSG